MICITQWLQPYRRNAYISPEIPGQTSLAFFPLRVGAGTAGRRAAACAQAASPLTKKKDILR
ncbi:hypothetical protein [Cyclobacterium xiamenense]|uniref:hypothetical protein n=1 Tax=Cyclobacterium xiamenense TaxID=1297121 RepID=UPI0035CF2214